jgi:hypothetical protein
MSDYIEDLPELPAGLHYIRDTDPGKPSELPGWEYTEDSELPEGFRRASYTGLDPETGKLRTWTFTEQDVDMIGHEVTDDAQRRERVEPAPARGMLAFLFLGASKLARYGGVRSCPDCPGWFVDRFKNTKRCSACKKKKANKESTERKALWRAKNDSPLPKGLCECGCGKPLTGRQESWSGNACRQRGKRKRESG